MARSPSSAHRFRGLVTYSGSNDSLANEHDRITRERLARRIAALLELPYASDLIDRGGNGPFFFVPGDTLLSSQAAALGIVHDGQLYGGVVPFPHVATKAISHGLIAEWVAAPQGWQAHLATLLEGSVLRGFTAFSIEDARRGGADMLVNGAVRAKDVTATGGRGQAVVASPTKWDEFVAALDPVRIAGEGLVIEENLSDVTTYSVGVTTLADETIAYWGTQRLTTSNQGKEVYGGSDLHVVRGSFDALLALDLTDELRRVVNQARHYDQSAFEVYPAIFASRRNYDVIAGTDFQGVRRSGVLEQSWRIGGSSGAEIAALEAFRSEPELTEIRTSTVEIFGESSPPPAHATVYYRGTDPVAGPVTKYAVIRS